MEKVRDYGLSNGILLHDPGTGKTSGGGGGGEFKLLFVCFIREFGRQIYGQTEEGKAYSSGAS